MLKNGARALRRRRALARPPDARRATRVLDRAIEQRREGGDALARGRPRPQQSFALTPLPLPLAARARLTHSPRPWPLRAVAALGERPSPPPVSSLPTRAASRSVLSRTALTWRKSSATCAGREGVGRTGAEGTGGVSPPSTSRPRARAPRAARALAPRPLPRPALPPASQRIHAQQEIKSVGAPALLASLPFDLPGGSRARASAMRAPPRPSGCSRPPFPAAAGRRRPRAIARAGWDRFGERFRSGPGNTFATLFPLYLKSA